VTLDALPYREIWAADFEFVARPGERPDPICLVARELRSGRTLRLWRDQFGPVPPYRIDADALFVCFYGSAELGCHRVLRWSMPARMLDLFCEFRNCTNGLPTPAGSGLLGALVAFGLDSIGATEKDDMRALILRGGPWSTTERTAILDYCESDVDALARLLPAMLGKKSIDLPRALLRGRYMAAVSAMEHYGVPIDQEMLSRLRRHWDAIQDQLIAKIDADYQVFDLRTFKADRFAEWLTRTGLPWPRLASGRLDLSDDAFRQMARAHPIVAPLRELRSSLAELRLTDLAVGRDGRNRCLLSPFRARSSRNQPSNSRYIFGPAVWLRGLITPPEGYGVAYVDWCQQEFGIAAALSGDPLMQEAYQSGDPYLAFAKQAGAAPPDATKKTHGEIRELFKQCVLATQYGMEANALASRIGGPPVLGRDLLRVHHETFRTFWKWSDQTVDHAVLTGSLHTVFGWTLHVGPDFNWRSLRNHPMQANGAEMLRLACCLATERGIEVCGPVHDALVICAPTERLADDVAATKDAMRAASRVVLSGFELTTECKIVIWPHRYMDPRGERMWRTVVPLVDQAEGEIEAIGVL
jgi:DNA polymerase-1